MADDAQFHSPVTEYLDAKGITYRRFKHAQPFETLQQAAEERGQTVRQIMRSILFRVQPTTAVLDASAYVLVLCPGDARVSWTVLRKYLKTGKLTMANSDEVLRITSFQIGSVSPFGLPPALRLLVDESCFTPKEISTGSGIIGSTIIMEQDEMARALPPHDRGVFVE